MGAMPASYQKSKRPEIGRPRDTTSVWLPSEKVNGAAVAEKVKVVPPDGSGWRGRGEPMMVGSGIHAANGEGVV